MKDYAEIEMSGDGVYCRRIKKIKWFVIILAITIITTFEVVYYYFYSVRPSFYGFFISWLVGVSIALVLTQLAFWKIAKIYNNLEQEIIKRRSVERKLRENEQQLLSILKTANEAIITIDNNEKIALWNSGAEKMFGYSRDEIIGKSFTELMPERFRKAYLKGIKRVIMTERKEIIDRVIELYGLRKDGSEFPFELSMAKWEIEKSIFSIAIVRDITQRKKVEKELEMYYNYLEDITTERTSHIRATMLKLQKEIAQRTGIHQKLSEYEERFRLLVEGVENYAIFMLDVNGNISSWNKGAQRIMGYSEDEIIGKHFSIFFSKDDIANGKPETMLAKAEVNGTSESESWHIRKDGSRYMAHILITALYDSDGNLRGFSKITQDITVRKNAEQKIRRVNRALKTILECNRILVSADDEAKLLNKICNTLITAGEYRMAWVGFVRDDNDEKRVYPAAWAGVENGYLQDAHITWDNSDTGSGPTGRAVRTGKVQICRNTRTDPDFVSWREEAIKRSYASSIAIPLIDEKRTIGTLNIYASKPDAFDDDEVRLLSQMADDLAFGIVTLRTRAQHEKAQEELIQAAERWQTTFDAITDIVTVISPRNDFINVNKAACDFIGLKKEELVGKKCYRVVHGTNAPIPECPCVKALKTANFEVSEYEQDDRFYELYAWPIFKDGEIIALTHIVKDITERKRAEEKLRAHQKQLKSLATELTLTEERERRRIATELHDTIAQSLAVAKLRLKTLKKTMKSSPLCKEIEQIDENLSASIKITRSIISELSPPILYESGIIKAMEWLLLKFQERYDWAVYFEDDNKPKHLDDETKITVFTCVRELLFNVAKHAQANTVKISTSRKDNYIQIIVQDDGIGFDTSKLPIVSSEEAGGFGLVSIRERLEYLGGKILIKSEHGKGTEVVLTAPLLYIDMNA